MKLRPPQRSMLSHFSVFTRVAIFVVADQAYVNRFL